MHAQWARAYSNKLACEQLNKSTNGAYLKLMGKPRLELSVRRDGAEIAAVSKSLACNDRDEGRAQ